MESLKFEQIYSQVEYLKGWMGKEDCRALYDYAKNISGLILEIGSFMGISTKVLALSSSQSQVISIDPYFSVHPSSGENDPEYVMERCIHEMFNFNWTLIRDKSQNAGKIWNRPIDFLHIDGDHHYEEVKQDIELFVPHVKKGCYVFFHDYVVKGGKEPDGRDEYGIVQAIDETKDYFDEIKVVSGFGVCRKK